MKNPPLSLGACCRKIFPPFLFRCAAAFYRGLFMDCGKLAGALPSLKGHLLDVGGGDGAILNSILSHHPDLRATLLDRNASAGSFLDKKYRHRVTLLPQTSLLDFAKMKKNPVDYVLISDVLHHVPRSEKRSFFEDLRQSTGPQTVFLVKDIEPGFLRSRLSMWADRWISGDNQVELVSRQDAAELFGEYFPGHRATESGLFQKDSPNYCLIFHPVERGVSLPR